MLAVIDPDSTTVVIGRILSPAFMVNAAALLLLSLHNKFSTLSARIRALNGERRHLRSAQSVDEDRLANLTRQIARLGTRLQHVRRAIMFHYTGIALFLLTSFIIALNTFVQRRWLAGADIAVFTIGMACVFWGTMCHLRDVHTGFGAIRLEAPDAFS